MQNEKLVLVGDKKIKFLCPTIGNVEISNLEFSKAYTKSLKAGLFPKAAMDTLIKEQGLWSSDDDKRSIELNTDIQECLLNFKIETDIEKKNSIKSKFVKLQNESLELLIKKQSLYENTAEAKGEQAKNISLFLQCSVNEDDSKIWNSDKEFYAEKDNGFIGEAIKQFMIFVRGIDEKIDNIDNFFEEKPKEDIVEADKEADDKETEKVEKG